MRKASGVLVGVPGLHVPEARVAKTRYMQVVNKEYRVEGWADGAHLYLEEVGLSHSLHWARSRDSNLVVPSKLNHVNAVGLEGCTLRLRNGAVSGVELTRLQKCRLFIRGPVSTLQVDLCEDVEIVFESKADALGCVIVHASNASIRILIKDEQDAAPVLLPSSILGDQQASFLDAHGVWAHRLTSAIKHEKRGYLEIDKVRH